MREMVNGFMLTQALAVVAELGIADYIASRPLAVAELARTSGSNEDALFRLIRYLAGFGIFAMDDDRRVSNTPLSRTLRTEAAGTVRNWAMLAGRSFRWSVTGNLMHTVRTGEPAFAATLGAPQWDYLAEHPEDGNQFNATMAELSTTMIPALIAAYDFADASVVVDVGGGTGATLAGILEANPAASGILFDLAEVVDKGRTLLAERGLEERVRCVAGDFFRAVPEGGDLYLLRAVLHDWSDADAAAILKRCHAAMKPGTRLLLNEGIFPDDDAPSLFRFGDVLMMVMLGGRERTRAEFRSLLASCGFDLRQVVPTASPLHVIEAVRR
jgi:SAM-dependent methyltransferase